MTTTTSLRRRRLLGLAVLVVLLAASIVASLALGSNPLPLGLVLDALTYRYSTGVDAADPVLNEAAIIVQSRRIPRTLLAVLVGAALAAAGALMQGHTRNAIADPGLLGITQGAAFAVVLAVFLGGLTDPLHYVWFALLGAAVAAAIVLGVSSLGSGIPSPLTLILAGSGTAVFLSSMTSAVALSSSQTLDALRFWNLGSVSGRGYDVLGTTAPFLVIGLVLALAGAPAANLLNLGDDVARGLGLDIARARFTGMAAVVLLAGAATAACGSIAFLGLVAPHVVRSFTGPDHRWVLPYSALLGAVLLLAADVVGRLVSRPGEIEVGIMLALVGAPFFIALVCRRSVAAL